MQLEDNAVELAALGLPVGFGKHAVGQMESSHQQMPFKPVQILPIESAALFDAYCRLVCCAPRLTAQSQTVAKYHHGLRPTMFSNGRQAR